MEIRIVVAASEDNFIGIDNQLPWHLPEDLRFFKKMTSGMPVVMGKNTWLSLGRALPNRLNVVISSSLNNLPEGVLIFDSLENAIAHLKSEGNETISIIGGGQIYKAALPFTDVVYLTRIHTILRNGTAAFPPLSENEWKLTWEEPHTADEKNKFDYTFQKWERI
ncbi:dihydrofolate reductase [Taibaiella lutea]|uniref:Dihydrofolate reductase n=1 Tax=Taibaiella lutea TaxID=2608001 RepID=A0A5M6CRB9_9BACT|nr:dihydrofolate reductase [Taibaiella lutea]KAA5536502.1 dihydrofolate reductase [Taibaiella lutea]